MSEFRLLRVLAVPAVLIVVFLIVVPRMCAPALIQIKQQKDAVAKGGGGLQIASSTPEPGRRPVNFPAGLDPVRIQYLLEIDQTFAAPKTVLATPDTLFGESLIARHYADRRPDGTLGPTTEGLINVNGGQDTPRGWVVPIATRKFVRVSNVEEARNGAYNVTVDWRWEPNPIAADLLRKPEEHQLIAEFAGSAMRGYVRPPDGEFR